MSENYTSNYDSFLNNKTSLINVKLGDLTTVQDLLDIIANSGAYDFTGSISGKSTQDVADAFGTPTDGTQSSIITDLINARLDTSAKEILGEFTFSGSGAIAMNTDTNNGLWLSPTGILGKKAGVTTFAIDTSGNATFKGDISGSTGTFSGTVAAENLTGTTITGKKFQTHSGSEAGIKIYTTEYNSASTGYFELWNNSGDSIILYTNKTTGNLHMEGGDLFLNAGLYVDGTLKMDGDAIDMDSHAINNVSDLFFTTHTSGTPSTNGQMRYYDDGTNYTMQLRMHSGDWHFTLAGGAY